MRDDAVSYNIKNALLLHAKDTLKSLAILRPFAQDKPLRSLNGFPKLKHLECEQRSLIGHTAAEFDMEGCFPPSIETITLYDRRCHRHCICALLDKFSDEFYGPFANLRALTLKEARCEEQVRTRKCKECKDGFWVKDCWRRRRFGLTIEDC